MWSLLPIFLNICTLAETRNNFEWNHLRKCFYHKNNLNQILEILLFYLVLILTLFLLLILLLFYSNQDCLWIQQLQIYQLIFLFYLWIKCLFSKFIIIIRSKILWFNVSAIAYWLSRLVRSCILFSTAVNATLIVKPKVLDVLPCISVILAL